MGTLIIPFGNFNVMFRGITSNGYGSSTLGVLTQVHIIWLSTTPSILDVLSQTCMYHGGITAGITVDKGIVLLALIQCMHVQIVVVTVCIP